MGLGPLDAIYQARFSRYLMHRGIKDTSQQRCGRSWGWETDEPESLGAIGLAAGRTWTTTFVINCNLQRLDGPVRGNGKIIQELESFFRGAGWNVIKVIWGRKWDDLLARDDEGALVNLMTNVTPDGDFQTYKAENGAYIREHFFGRDPGLRHSSKAGTTTRSGVCSAVAMTTRSCMPAYAAATTPPGSRRSSWPRRSKVGHWAPTSRVATRPIR